MKKLNFLLMNIITISLITSCVKEPSADFSFSSSTDVGETIQFTNLSSNSDTYSWDFGDGSNSTNESPSHKYEKPETYIVTLSVKGKGGSDVISKSIKITGITYSFKNNTSYTLYDFCSYYWTGSEVEDLIEHGTLSIGEETDIIITNRTQIDFGFRFSSSGDLYISTNSFNLTINKHNDLIITDNTNIYGKKSAIINNIDMLNYKIIKVENEMRK